MKRVAILLVFSLLFFCSRKKPSDYIDWEKLKTSGTLIFEENFENPKEVEKNFESHSKYWKVENGSLKGTKTFNKGFWLKLKLPDNVRIEFEAKSLTPPDGSKFRGDIKCEAFAREKKHQSGYIFIFGGWINSISIIARLNEHGKDRLEKTDVKVEPDRTYQFTIIRYKGKIRWYIDGKLFLEYNDKNPINGHYFGFNNWESFVVFDNLKIYKL